MKITKSCNYKKPLYAAGVAAAIMAVSVSGCTNPAKETGNTVPVYEGDVQIVDNDETCNETGKTDNSDTSIADPEDIGIVATITAGIVHVYVE